MRLAAAADPDEEAVIPEERDELDELAWSDTSRTTVAVHVSAALLSWTFLSVDDAAKPWAWACVFAYASLTASTQRVRRSLAAPLQAGVAAFGATAFALAGTRARRRLWAPSAACLYLVEALLWRAQTADLISIAFGRFQRHLFAAIVVATVWGLPFLYDAAERLESDANLHAADARLVEATTDGFYQQFAGALLYGGTVLLLSVSVAIWVRMYRVAPELFRLLVAVALAGAVAGSVLHAAGEPDGPMLTGASCCSFVAMAYCVLPDRRTSHALAALAACLYLASRLFERPRFAALCLAVHVALKFLFAAQLHLLAARVPRRLPRLSHPLATFLLPAAAAAATA